MNTGARSVSCKPLNAKDALADRLQTDSWAGQPLLASVAIVTDSTLITAKAKHNDNRIWLCVPVINNGLIRKLFFNYSKTSL